MQHRGAARLPAEGGMKMAAEQARIILKTEGLTKRYGGVHALEEADFELRDGEHVAVVGDNGAGKSTFVRQITGVEQPTAGKIYFDGELVEFKNPIEARNHGIETVFQNLALADDLDVASNLFLGREERYFNLGPFSILNEKKMLNHTQEALRQTGVKIPNLKNKIRNMSGGQRQCVAISRAASFASKLIIMDEPTAALGVQETAQVENIIRGLKQRGIPLILISHNLRQVFDLVDRIWVFRRGKIVGVVDRDKTDGNEVVSLITGVKSTIGGGEAAFV
jgi:fructose transport system ATP-binding protein